MDAFHNPNDIEQKILKDLALEGARSFAKKFLAPILPIIYSILGTLFLIFFFIALAYTVIFVMPQQIAEETGGARKAFFSLDDARATTLTMEDDQMLYQKYRELADSWKKGLDEYQQEQAENYALPWSVLAAVDRIFGDPMINLNIKDETDYKPEPEKNYEILKPIFQWKDSTITRRLVWQEKVEVGTDANGKPIYRTETRTSTETKNVKLLTMVDTFEAKYAMEYETVTETRTENGVTITETKEVVKRVIESGPYYERLKKLLAQHGLKEREVELVLELAKIYDENYQFSLDTRWVEVNSFTVDHTKQYYTGKMGEVTWPLPSNYKRVSSEFGWRIHPIRKTRSFHTGIDLPAPQGTPVYAISDGYVRFSGNKGAYGQMIIIEHGDNIFTAYCHLSKRIAKAGEYVKRGQVIGLVGSTGLSTGPHLHLEARKVVNGRINYFHPMELLK